MKRPQNKRHNAKAEIQNQIRLQASELGWRLWRNNVGAGNYRDVYVIIVRDCGYFSFSWRDRDHEYHAGDSDRENQGDRVAQSAGSQEKNDHYPVFNRIDNPDIQRWGDRGDSRDIVVLCSFQAAIQCVCDLARVGIVGFRGVGGDRNSVWLVSGPKSLKIAADRGIEIRINMLNFGNGGYCKRK